jgi:hypothetical protein
MDQSNAFSSHHYPYKTSSIAVDIACNKELTKKMLDMASIPVASGSICVKTIWQRP